jgi:hypothetical protein
VREANACVAGGAFDDGSAWFEGAVLFGLFYEEEGGAVFDGAAGVLEFGFSEDRAGGFGGEGF